MSLTILALSIAASVALFFTRKQTTTADLNSCDDNYFFDLNDELARDSYLVRSS